MKRIWCWSLTIVIWPLVCFVTNSDSHLYAGTQNMKTAEKIILFCGKYRELNFFSNKLFAMNFQEPSGICYWFQDSWEMVKQKYEISRHFSPTVFPGPPRSLTKMEFSHSWIPFVQNPLLFCGKVGDLKFWCQEKAITQLCVKNTTRASGALGERLLFLNLCIPLFQHFSNGMQSVRWKIKDSVKVGDTFGPF